MKEADLVREIHQYLAIRKVWFFRASVGTCRVPSGRTVRFSTKGHPDFYCRSRPRKGAGPARVLWIEAKTKTGKLSPEQEDWKKTAERHGDLYVIARNLEDVMGVV